MDKTNKIESFFTAGVEFAKVVLILCLLAPFAYCALHKEDISKSGNADGVQQTKTAKIG